MLLLNLPFVAILTAIVLLAVGALKLWRHDRRLSSLIMLIAVSVQLAGVVCMVVAPHFYSIVSSGQPVRFHLNSFDVAARILIAPGMLFFSLGFIAHTFKPADHEAA
jgi:hypothetical protein